MWFLNFIIASAIVCNIVFWGYTLKIFCEFRSKYTYVKAKSKFRLGETLLKIAYCILPMCIFPINIMFILMMPFVDKNAIIELTAKQYNAKLK